MFVAALAMLLRQLRERAPTPEVVSSVQRLCALAHLGSVTIDLMVINDAEGVDAVRDSARFLRTVLQEHGVTGLDIASTVTEAELLKLGGILIGPASTVRGAILDSAEALAIWNVRLRAEGMPLRPTPIGMAAIPAPVAATTRPAAAPAPAAAPVAVPGKRAGQDVVEQGVRTAIAKGDGLSVFKLLSGVEDAAQFEQLATAEALQLVVELLLDQQQEHDAVQALLLRAGVPGARAVFEQLIAATELVDRRFLYDVAASLPATLAVARHYAGDPTWYVVRNAAGLMGDTKNAAAIPDLARLLKHTDTRVRVAAVAALGQIGGPAAMGRLESVMFDSTPEVRNRALSLVFAAPDADPLADRMMLAVQEESSLEYQLEIIAALAHVHTPRARQKLVQLTAERSRSLDDLQIRLAAITALAAGHRPAADAALRTLSTDTHSLIRERATAALAVAR